MPNIKSSEKRALIAKENNARNKAAKSSLKTSVKKFDAAVSAGDRSAAESAYKAAVKTVDRAATKGLIHKNNAARKKSRLQTKLNGLPQ